MTHYRIFCIRSANSIFGASTGYAKRDGVIEEYTDEEKAQDRVNHLNLTTKSPNVLYRLRLID